VAPAPQCMELALKVMATWNLKELRDLHSSCLSEQKQKELSEFLDSFDWKSKAAYYHIFQADESFKDYLNLDKDLIAQKLTSGEQEFVVAQKIREISLVSAVMTANTLPEVLAQIINIVMLTSRIGINDVSLSKVVQAMSPGKLKSKLELLHSSSEGKYITAFTNTLKHIHLVKPSCHVSYEPDSFHGVMFKEFEYKGSPFPEQRDIEIIRIVKEYRTRCVEVGSEINSEIR
jgi:hypothetical protein